MGLLRTLTPGYAVSVATYALMDNHFHMVVYFDPLANRTWPDEEVAQRWYLSHPSQLRDPTDDQERREKEELLASDPEEVERCRRHLGSLSEFMKALKVSMSRWANREVDSGGHFWDDRFYSGAILSEQSLMTTMAYVDLNPIRAKIARTIEESVHTGLYDRVQAAELDAAALAAYLAPCFDGLKDRSGVVKQTLKAYRAFIEELLRAESSLPKPSQPISGNPLTREEVWRAAKQTLRDKPRVIGRTDDVLEWLEERGFKLRGPLLPEQLA